MTCNNAEKLNNADYEKVSTVNTIMLKREEKPYHLD